MTCHANYLLKYHCKYVMMTHDCDDLSFGGFIMRSVLQSDRVRMAKIDLTQCQKYAPVILPINVTLQLISGYFQTFSCRLSKIAKKIATTTHA